jgi:hypothetical protein
MVIQEEDDKDKARFISFDLKVNADGAITSPKYKKLVKTFDEGTPQEWFDFLSSIREIWSQNGVLKASDRSATVAAILKGDSLIAYESALAEARTDSTNLNITAPLAIDHIETALSAVADIVFPHRALEIQRLWMNREMKKPFNLSTQKTIAALNRLNNLLPLFPTGTQASKFSDTEIVGLLEWAVPEGWRRKFDLKGYIPSSHDKKRFLFECEIIERSEMVARETGGQEEHKNQKKERFNKSANHQKPNGAKGEVSKRYKEDYFCTECGQNRTHNTEKCFKLQNRASRDKSHSGHKSEQKPKPFSKRTFRKEVNAIARKAAKKGTLDLYAAALAREQNKLDKQAKKKTVKKTVAANADSDSSSDESMNNLEEKIPKKKAFRGKLLKRPPNIFDRNVKMPFSEKEIRESLKYLQKQRKTVEILIPDSEEEEEDVNASEEERAFLMAIDQEEKLQKTAEMETNSSNDSNN